MKCGTTSLHAYLAEHPAIEVSSDKEPHYFAGNPKAYDESGYLKLWRDNPAALYFCESSTSYSKSHLFPSAIELIGEVCNMPKFIYIVRNPIDRIESHYNHSVACSDDARSPEAVFAGDLNNNKYLRTSEYFAQIKPYCDTFGRENILILDLIFAIPYLYLSQYLDNICLIKQMLLLLLIQYKQHVYSLYYMMV